MGLSVGVAMYPDDTSDIDDLYADAEMYRNKRDRAAEQGGQALAEHGAGLVEGKSR